MTIIGFFIWVIAAVNMFADRWQAAFFWLGTAIFFTLVGES